MDLESQQFKRWLRRPTVFMANAWYLLAASGQLLLSEIILLVVQALSLFGISLNAGSVSYASSAAYQLLILALPVVWYAARHEGVNQAMRLNPPRPAMMLYAAGTAVLGVLAMNYLGTWWLLLIERLGGRLYDSGVPVPTNVSELTASILMVGVLPGVCEELFFRGGLMGAWERRGTKKALVITTALFAMLHGSLQGLPTQIIMGFVLGYVMLLSDSLYVSMIYHTVHNSTIMLLSYDPVGASAAQSTATLAEQVAVSGGYFSLVIQTFVMGLLFIAALRLMSMSQLKRGVSIEKVTETETEPMDWRELLLLIAGLLTVGLLYFNDFLMICGLI